MWGPALEQLTHNILRVPSLQPNTGVTGLTPAHVAPSAVTDSNSRPALVLAARVLAMESTRNRFPVQPELKKVGQLGLIRVHAAPRVVQVSSSKRDHVQVVLANVSVPAPKPFYAKPVYLKSYLTGQTTAHVAPRVVMGYSSNLAHAKVVWVCVLTLRCSSLSIASLVQLKRGRHGQT